MTVQDVIDSLPDYPKESPLPAPAYALPANVAERPRIMLAVPSMERHMSDEGHQLALALQAGGYELYGGGWTTTHVREILKNDPAVVMVQDQHEWNSGHLAKKEEFFHGIGALAERPDVFRLTVMKDTHRQYESNKWHSRQIECHAWITYYDVRITLHTLSWLRPQHLIRTWHTLDSKLVPPFSVDRQTCLLSGSLGGAYPLRTRIHEAGLRDVTFLRHPGYNNRGTSTPGYLEKLSQFKVAICTASKFGYALRKLIEATACGCVVITDLPSDEVLPEIDDNLIRVSPDVKMAELNELIQHHANGWHPSLQEKFAEAAKRRYDWAVEGTRLANEIERTRSGYDG